MKIVDKLNEGLTGMSDVGSNRRVGSQSVVESIGNRRQTNLSVHTTNYDGYASLDRKNERVKINNFNS